MLALDFENSHRLTRTARRQQQCEESAKMELRKEELTKEQLQQMTEFHSKK
jgi:outer membrane protein assembly factor BamE (lipoprotein component of BamABCDE complex)